MSETTCECGRCDVRRVPSGEIRFDYFELRAVGCVDTHCLPFPGYCPECSTKFSLVNGAVVVETRRDLIRRAWKAGAKKGIERAWHNGMTLPAPAPTDADLDRLEAGHE